MTEQRKEFVDLLDKVFGVTTDNGYHFNFKDKGLTQKEEAEKLGIDNSTFGKMLRPDYSGSYKSINAHLRTKLELKKRKDFSLAEHNNFFG